MVNNVISQQQKEIQLTAQANQQGGEDLSGVIHILTKMYC